MKYYDTYLKHSGATVDYYQLKPKAKKAWMDRTLDNLNYVKNNTNLDYLFDEHLYWKSVLPRRSQDSPLGPGLNNAYEYVSELRTSKMYGDLSGKQITGLNYINRVLDCEELQGKLPNDPYVYYDNSNKYMIEYKMVGGKKQRIYTDKLNPSGTSFEDLFSY